MSEIIDVFHFEPWADEEWIEIIKVCEKIEHGIESERKVIKD